MTVGLRSRQTRAVSVFGSPASSPDAGANPAPHSRVVEEQDAADAAHDHDAGGDAGVVGGDSLHAPPAESATAGAAQAQLQLLVGDLVVEEEEVQQDGGDEEDAEGRDAGHGVHVEPEAGHGDALRSQQGEQRGGACGRGRER